VSEIPAASSITHQHITAVVNSETQELHGAVRVLDAGCGDGVMLSYMAQTLTRLRSDILWEVYGFDVVDEGVQANIKFLEGARALLVRTGHSHPNEQIRGILSRDAWPYDDGFFDVVVSNQVLEHVRSLSLFMDESARVLKDGGLGVHLFPLRSVLYEGHVHVPLTHKIDDHDLAVWWLRVANKFHIGRFDTYNVPGDSLDDFAAKEADRVWNYTFYRSAHEVLGVCRKAGMRATLRYTPEFYRAKLRAISHQPSKFKYSSAWKPTEWLAGRLLARVSSVTLVTKKTNMVEPDTQASV
jgi:SAM-dependent methyltransferase